MLGQWRDSGVTGMEEMTEQRDRSESAAGAQSPMPNLLGTFRLLTTCQAMLTY